MNQQMLRAMKYLPTYLLSLKVEFQLNASVMSRKSFQPEPVGQPTHPNRKLLLQMSGLSCMTF